MESSSEEYFYRADLVKEGDRIRLRPLTSVEELPASLGLFAEACRAIGAFFGDTVRFSLFEPPSQEERPSLDPNAFLTGSKELPFTIRHPVADRAFDQPLRMTCAAAGADGGTDGGGGGGGG